LPALLFFFGPQQDASTSASISLESSNENFTIYVPVLLDENKNVLKMYDTPAISGNVTTAIVDTEHGKALKISKSGLGNYLFNWNEVPGKDTDRFVKWMESRGSAQPGEKLEIKKIDNGRVIAVTGRFPYCCQYRLYEDKTLTLYDGDPKAQDLFFAKEENGQLNIYAGKNEINIQEQHVKPKKDNETSDEFFGRFTISMSNYTSPEPFIKMPVPESPSKIGAWVYSDSEIEKVSFYFYLEPSDRINQTSLDIGTEGWVHLRKGWQVVNLSGGIAVY